ncbi:MAG: ribbon-helix-helix domain-containing protein [Promethearchaeota archaeon]
MQENNKEEMSSKENKNSSRVITIRISQDLNEHLDKLKDRLGVSKADLIRNYLELSRFIIKERNSLKSLNNRNFIVIKRNYLRKLIEKSDEAEQIRLGDSLARFINDISRIVGKIDDIDYKLEMCQQLGFFEKFIDKSNYVLIPKEFGPQKFVEAFLWRLFKEKEMNVNYTEENLNSNKSLKSKYKNEFKPVERSTSHFSYEFAKL